MTGPVGPGAEDEKPADRVGPYHLLRLLGSGGMGEVHLARSESDGTHVALKLVHPEFAADPEFRARFRQEVDAAGKVLSFFTVPLVDAGPDDPTPWLATQYVPGDSLDGAVRSRGPLPLDKLCTLAAALGEALVVIHASDIVHRDLKPSNVLLADDGPRVIDFGIARAADATDLTGTGMAIGTLGYASPEQLVGEGPVGPKSDVYSLGAVLLFAGTGGPPFGQTPAAALAYRTVHDTPDTSEVPDALRALVRDCLSRDPADRPSPAQVIARARAAQALHPPAPAPTPSSPAAGVSNQPRPETSSYPLAPPAPPAGLPVPPPGTGMSDETPGAAKGVVRTLLARRATRVGLAGAVAVAVLLGVGFRLFPGDQLHGPSDDTQTSASPEPKDDGGSGKNRREAAPKPSGPPADSHQEITAAGERERAWRSSAAGKEDGNRLMGGWLTEHAAARTTVDRTEGLDPDSGERLWTVEPPQGDEVVCQTSLGRSATHDGVGAVLYGAELDMESCTTIGAIDTRTGRLLWHKDVGGSLTGEPTLGMSGGNLITTREDALVGLDPRTGKESWHRTDDLDRCWLKSALTGPRTTTLLEVCGTASTPNTVVEIDSATGKERWRFGLPKNAVDSGIVTAEPTSVALRRGGDGSKDALLVFDGAGRRHHEIPAQTDKRKLHLDHDEHYGRGDVAASGDTVLLPGGPPGGNRADSDLVAVDVRSGKVRWQRDVSLSMPRILDVGKNGVSVLTAPVLDDPARVVRYRLKTGTVAGDGTVAESYDKPADERVIADGDSLYVFVGYRDVGVAAYAVPDEEP